MTPSPKSPPVARRAAPKRLLDVAVGSAMLLCAIPVMVVLAAIVAIDLRATPFFVHTRVGHDGRLLRFPKLRTLPPDTPRYALKSTATFSLSPFRSWLRRSHLDELPQLLLVLTGDLSLVGPRPRMPESHEPADLDYQRMREAVPQGCTGLWQIGAHAHLLPTAHPEYDRLYVGSGGTVVDLWILSVTVGQLLGLAGRVRLDQLPSPIARRLGVAEPPPRRLATALGRPTTGVRHHATVRLHTPGHMTSSTVTARRTPVGVDAGR